MRPIPRKGRVHIVPISTPVSRREEGRKKRRKDVPSFLNSGHYRKRGKEAIFLYLKIKGGGRKGIADSAQKGRGNGTRFLFLLLEKRGKGGHSRKKKRRIESISIPSA